jgi:transcriptional regulator with XRE-family HTH domain
MGKGRRRSAVYEPEYRDMIRLVREARVESGLTQGEVASALQRPLSFVSKCELGERRIDPVDLVKFADLYDKPYEYFFPRRRSRKRKAP